jgi:uncharacterized protein (TIGR03437 family)
LVLGALALGRRNRPCPRENAVTGTPAVNGSVTVTVGGAPVNVLYAILSPDATGLYQIAIQLPASVPTGAVALQAFDGASHFPRHSVDLRSAAVNRASAEGWSVIVARAEGYCSCTSSR